MSRMAPTAGPGRPAPPPPGSPHARSSGLFRADLDTELTYRLLRDILWIPEQWRRTRDYGTDQVVDGFLRILFDGIANRA
jgi:hypothetical protein